MSRVYYEFAGWFEIDPDTKLLYCGDNENCDPIITARVWKTLSKEHRADYILEDFVAAYRDAGDYDFIESNLILED